MFNGATQLVPVSSSPERAEVLVDGVSMGFTPVELTLWRNADVTVEVRLGDQVRSFVLPSETQGAMVALDLVPVGVAGGRGLEQPPEGGVIGVAAVECGVEGSGVEDQRHARGPGRSSLDWRGVVPGGVRGSTGWCVPRHHDRARDVTSHLGPAWVAGSSVR